ncbi:GNAT family N-acetyltransferase [Herbaspirillum sp.]|uniref:GNAT family N-acetyltransferase n=1 Tax=Herbaspirillum sp. TaxID=1890675 RepID=UPI001AFFA813|nr:GNAT family N-acetyltransferase [Herbaspirillum sp.]MBO9536969.1 GNAT family N-acetyltransferase [Herbaspirillum sp.]
MRIEALTPDFAERYEAFLLARPETLLYQSWRYQNLLIDLLGCRQQSLLALDDNDQLLAVLPLMSMDGPFGTVLNSLPFYGSNGGLVGKDPNARAGLIDAYTQMAQASGIAAATIIENPLAPDGADGASYNITDERIGQLTPLPHTDNVEETLMQSFHYKTRNMIRKAEKLGVEVTVDNDAMPFLVGVHEENMREIGGLAKSRRFFDALPRHFRPGEDYRIYVARLGQELVAAMLVFFYNRTAEYYTPVVRKEYRESQALSAAIFRAMSDAAAQGFAWWNWGGTWLSQDGVYRFKSRWGTQDRRYRYFTSVHNPEILKASRAELLAAYPSFFTVPFSALSA